MALKAGQLRRWTTLPRVFGFPHTANGLQFRVTDADEAKGEYTEPDGASAGFTVAEPSFMESHSTEEPEKGREP